MLQVTPDYLVQGTPKFLVKQFCNDIPKVKTIADQMRDSVFMGNKLCEGTVTHINLEPSLGITEITTVNLRSHDSYAVSQDTFFTKKKEPVKCPEQSPTPCSLTIDGDTASPQVQYRRVGGAGHSQKLECRG